MTINCADPSFIKSKAHRKKPPNRKKQGSNLSTKYKLGQPTNHGERELVIMYLSA